MEAVLIKGLAGEVAHENLLIVNSAQARLVTQEVIEPEPQRQCQLLH